MDQARRTELRDLYYHTLVDDVVPFWLNHALDREYGGYLMSGRDGSVTTRTRRSGSRAGACGCSRRSITRWSRAKVA